jgi:hypothetical protein
MSNINESDYIKILEYYNIKVPKSKNLLKSVAENIMANKLCKCIKKIDTNNEATSIGICTKTIFNNKGFKRGKFTCKKKRKVYFSKKSKRKY